MAASLFILVVLTPPIQSSVQIVAILDSTELQLIVNTNVDGGWLVK